MPNRNLDIKELAIANELLNRLRAEMSILADGDDALLFALRRKIAKELTYDERGKPMLRKLLKSRKYGEQSGLCAECSGALPEKYSVLDRKSAIAGYTAENTELICPTCDTKRQLARGYKELLLTSWRRSQRKHIRPRIMQVPTHTSIHRARLLFEVAPVNILQLLDQRERRMIPRSKR